MAHDVFISYSSRDKPIADAVCAGLEAAGVRCWIAPRDIVGGQSWASAIIGGIENARVMVVVFTDNVNASPQVLSEVERAVHKRLWLVSLRIEDVAPSKDFEYFLSSRHWLDAITPPVQRHIQKLADDIRRLLELPARPQAATTTEPRPIVIDDEVQFDDWGSVRRPGLLSKLMDLLKDK